MLEEFKQTLNPTPGQEKTKVVSIDEDVVVITVDAED